MVSKNEYYDDIYETDTPGKSGQDWSREHVVVGTDFDSARLYDTN